MRLSHFWKTISAQVRGSRDGLGTEARAAMWVGFDWEFYLRIHPDLTQAGITTESAARKHWSKCGWAEGRISGMNCLRYVQNRRQFEQYLAALQDFNPSPVVAPGPLINVLTRTNRREKFFSENRASVVGQSYRNFRHWISYENAETYDYLERSQLPPADLVKVSRANRSGTHPYNLFVNDLMERVTDGWILFLDDDDCFTTPQALAIIAGQLADEDSLVIWRAWMPAQTVPVTRAVDRIKLGGITSCCFAFHHRHKQHGQWHAARAGDYRCFEQLRLRLQPVFLDHILTQVNHTYRGGSNGAEQDKVA